ncbi:AAA ATPase midasin [Cichlidogyrus casuarinus]|uniref:Midasin n=1 Tax=Cichlidogyrus casuarinus TaxID=1844966 RepID=A0ABD2Q901_9PLAT
MPDFVVLAQMESAIDALKLALERRDPILISGPIGCGKTALISKMIASSQVDFIRLQISEETDSKDLLGTYRCCETPGLFQWSQGPLLHSIISGKWLILEDIDRSSIELPPILNPVLRSESVPRIVHPQTGEYVNIHTNFRLIMTRRTSEQKSSCPGFLDIVERNSCLVNLQPLSSQSIKQIAVQCYPKLEPAILGRIIEVYQDMSTKNVMPGSRLLSPRDLMKLLVRLSDCDMNDRESVFIHMFDTFTASRPRTEVDTCFAGLCNLTPDAMKHILEVRSPKIHLEGSFLTVGTSKLTCKTSLDWELGKFSNDTPFASTRLASNLLERISNCVQRKEPVLLVGETGTGKTSCIQRLAQLSGRTLRVINLNQQSDSVDLLGGFKPVELLALMRPLKDKFERLFLDTFTYDSNKTFLKHLQTAFNLSRWSEWLQTRWRNLNVQIKELQLRTAEERMDSKEACKMAFTFVEGMLVHAIADGDWVLLDEINLAPPEMLDCLSGLLEGCSGSLTITSRGDLRPIARHPDFQLFGAMNPSTDVGKKNLPVSLRNRFTELYVDELDGQRNTADNADLQKIIKTYLTALTPAPAEIATIVNLYSAAAELARTGLVDGVGNRPHYSLRTLCRALVEMGRAYHGSTLRSIYEGFMFSFGSQVSRESRPLLEAVVDKFLFSQAKSHKAQILGAPLSAPDASNAYLPVQGYWIKKGPLFQHQPKDDPRYILTATVRENLKDLARVVSAGGSLPVLLQGETSVGKTSLITYLGEYVGQVVYRINNHEHTDLQSYLGSYVSGDSGPLKFQEGILVQAMRLGHWLILDELNLAPTEILEALNRVLDDNRELFIPETQELVKAHADFRLFATQNPPGAYGGRKVLSRALRNRFIELHFDVLPRPELEVILEKRCHLPLSRAKMMLEVMHQLQLHRRDSSLFQGKDSFVTLRDLFRWAERYRLATCDGPNALFDWDEYLACQGYLLLAGRVRRPEEAKVIADAIGKVFKRDIVEESLFDLDQTDTTFALTSECRDACFKEAVVHLAEDNCAFRSIVWTHDMKRLLLLIWNALKYKEPVLLVGETGCGKTTICQIFSAINQLAFFQLNCHQYTEASDFLGGLRPQSEGRLFDWVDGPLVQAMSGGGLFLVDEISLAEDAVIERLNSVLEPERRLLLAERGGDHLHQEIDLKAHETFRLVATMNPGGDYGKKELSPALRNRFTEIWCPSPLFQPGQVELESREVRNWAMIIEHNLKLQLVNQVDEPLLCKLAQVMAQFAGWFAHFLHSSDIASLFSRRPPPTIRDLLAWINFMASAKVDCGEDLLLQCTHGVCLLFLDALESENSEERALVVEEVLNHLNKTLQLHGLHLPQALLDDFIEIESGRRNLRPQQFCMRQKDNALQFGCDYFFTACGSHFKKGVNANRGSRFSLHCPTAALNMYRVLRGLQLNSRAILLEGSPGVGKTSLVTALARCTGHKLVRINLSEATEACDLFGCDLPDETATEAGRFAWRDGPLLTALKAGHWILLDEMNLAPQPVLECLNACLDHRGSVYIPELNRNFQINSKETRIFACQNPLKEGGGRKALPKSFLNRFTQVHLTCMASEDYQLVLENVFRDRIPHAMLAAMLRFHHELVATLKDPGSDFARLGGPWEFNLRDLLRWAELLLNHSDTPRNPGLFVHLVYSARLRTMQDRDTVHRIWSSVCDFAFYEPLGRVLVHSSSQLRLGTTQLPHSTLANSPDFLLLPRLRPSLEQLVKCIEMSWMAILGGVFRWVDSPLLTAIREGHWMLLEHAELCSPSVLDRLNPLLEPDGELVLTERGLDAQGRSIAIRPHPNFRLILAVNEGLGAVNGGLSRAMRNRGIEIYLLPNEASIIVPSPRFENDVTLLRAIGLSFHEAATLAQLHSQLLLPLEPHSTEFLQRHLRPLPTRSLLAAGHEFRQLTTGTKRMFDADAWEQVVRHFFLNRQTHPLCSQFVHANFQQVLAQCVDFAAEVELRTRPTTACQLQQLQERAALLREVSQDLVSVDLQLDPYWNPCAEGAADALQVAFRCRTEQLAKEVARLGHEYLDGGSVASTVQEYEEMTVLQASVLAQRSDCPVAVREAFPQLSLYSKSPQIHSDLPEARDSVQQFARLTFWMQEFLRAPLGSAQDWPDRHRFFSNFVGSSSEAKTVQETLRESLDRPQPRVVEPSTDRWQLHELSSAFHQELVDLATSPGELQLVSQDFFQVEKQEWTLLPLFLLKEFNSCKSSLEAWFLLLCVLARRPAWKALAFEALSYETLADCLQQQNRNFCLFDQQSLVYFGAAVTAKPCLWETSFSLNQMLFDYATPHLLANGCSLSKWKTSLAKLVNLLRGLLTINEPPRVEILPEASVLEECEQLIKHKIEAAHQATILGEEFAQLLGQLTSDKSPAKKCLILGLLLIYSARITIPLDPYQVKMIHKRALDQEKELILKEIAAFIQISRVYFGSSYDLNLELVEPELRASVAEGLEHPWHLGLVQRRQTICAELDTWQELDAQVAQHRCQGNRQFAAIRERIASFCQAYGHRFLINFLHCDETPNEKLMDVARRWCNAAADLLSWLLSPTRCNLYADLIHPFVVALNMILRALTQVSLEQRSLNADKVQQLVILATDPSKLTVRSELELAYRISSPDAVTCLSGLLEKCRSRSGKRRDEETATDTFLRDHWRFSRIQLDFTYNMLVTALLQVRFNSHLGLPAIR